MGISVVDSLSSIWTNSHGSNDYSCLSEIGGKYGVYIFRDPINKDVLYVGEARDQDLRTRVKQNFTERDTGGTFRRNYMEARNADFAKFVEFVKNKQILCFTLQKGMLIRALESMLIFTLKPEYNKDL